jgi:hypothetical protein
MSVSSTRAEQREKHCGCHPDECVETNYNTQKIINTERLNYCQEVYIAAGEVNKWKKSYDGENNLFNRRKCMFVMTEGNYHRFRNTEFCVGTELMQATDLIGANVKSYVEWGSKLSTSLQEIFKKVKDAKGKLGELVDAACKLENSKSNTCFQTEWTILTGKPPVKCGEEPHPTAESPKVFPQKCKDMDKTICDLKCIPAALNKDINSLFKSSSEVIGIQIFSNIATLDLIQKTFAEKAKAFDSHLLDVIKQREADLKKLKDALVKSVQETTKAASALYTSRSNYEGLYDTVRYFCCPKCGCILKTDDDCKAKLHDCECAICEICGNVKDTFCSGDCSNDQTEAD